MYSKFNLLTNKVYEPQECIACIFKNIKLRHNNCKVDNTDCRSCYNKKYCYYNIGMKIFNKNKNLIAENISKYMDVNGVLEISQIGKEWFPNIEADIFLSHSHKDEKLAIAFAGWLYYNFGLITFIDSCIWSYSDDLLKKIDEKYCKNKKRRIYYYDTRNISTTHVHMMLMNALMKMIDKSECVFFLNTDNSIIKIKEEIDKNIEKTYSPWIYSEINATNLIRRKPLFPPRRNIGKIFN